MKNVLLAVVVIPLTAAATAGATVIAIKYANVLGAPALIAAQPTTAERPQPARPRAPERASDVAPLVQPASGTPAPAFEPLDPIARLASPEAPNTTPALRMASHRVVEPPDVTTPATSGTANQPDAPPETPAPRDARAGDEAIDFLKLTDDLQDLSQRLERFNRKLMQVLNQADDDRRPPAQDLTEEDAP